MILTFSRRSGLRLLVLSGMAGAILSYSARAAEADVVDWSDMVMGLFGGLALFLFGMDIMTASLKAVAGERLQRILAGLTRNRFMGALTGAAVTAVIQSSSITTVLLVGFVATHLMSLTQAVGVVMGANIGTTVTAQIIAFKVTHYALWLVAAGFLLQFMAAGRDRVKHGGGVLLGLGLIFFGMAVMSDAMRPLQSYQPFLDLLPRLGSALPAISLAALFTALVQSSSASIGISIVMAGQGFITLEMGIALAFGANIGTCITALLASIGKSREALRVGVVHILFNVLGVLIWIGLIDHLAAFVRQISPSFPLLDGSALLAAEVPRQIANANTLFNIANTLIFIGFAGWFAWLAQHIVPERPVREKELRPRYLDAILLNTPALALAAVRREIDRVGWRVERMFDAILPAILQGGQATLEHIARMDNEVDILHAHLVAYLGDIGKHPLNRDQTATMLSLMEVCNNLEHIGDVIETNLVVLGQQRIAEHIELHPANVERLEQIQREVAQQLGVAITAVIQNETAMGRSVMAVKADLHAKIQDMQRAGLQEVGRAEPARIAAYALENDTLEQFKRVYYFARRIAKSVVPEQEESREGAHSTGTEESLGRE